MSSLCRNLIVVATLVAAVLVPASARAAWLGYTNDTREPLVVQISVIINNQERRSQPRSINPRERNFEPIVQPGVQLLYINVFTPQLRPIGRFPIQFTGRDAFYSIQVDPIATQVDKKLTLRLLEIRQPPPGFGVPGAMPGLMPGFPAPGFPAPPPGFQPAMPGAVPLPGVGSAPAAPTPPAPPPIGSTTSPLTPKKN